MHTRGGSQAWPFSSPAERSRAWPLPPHTILYCMSVGSAVFAGWLQAAHATSSGAAPQALASNPQLHPPSAADDLSDPSSPSTALEQPHAHSGAGFTQVATMGPAESGAPGGGSSSWEGGLVAAGTSGGCLCLLDVERGELAAHFHCAPGAQVGGALQRGWALLPWIWSLQGAAHGWQVMLSAPVSESADLTYSCTPLAGAVCGACRCGRLRPLLRGALGGGGHAGWVDQRAGRAERRGSVVVPPPRGGAHLVGCLPRPLPCLRGQGTLPRCSPLALLLSV